MPWSSHTITATTQATPGVIFTDPEVASVGHTEAAARDAGIDVRTIEYDVGNLAGSSVRVDGYAGHAKLVVDAGRDVIVGATFVGPAIGDLLHAATTTG